MANAPSAARDEIPGGIPGEEHLDWIVPVPAAVLALSPLTHRNIKKGCRKCTVKREDGTTVERLYVLLQDNKAIDLGWLGGKLPQHLMSTLISERVPEGAESIHASRSPSHSGGRWTTYITAIINVALMMGQIGIDLSLAANRMLDAEGKGPHLFVDALLLSQAVGMATCFPRREEGYGSEEIEGDNEEEEEGKKGGGAGGKEEEAKVETMEVVGAGEGSKTEGAEGGGQVKTEEGGEGAVDGGEGGAGASEEKEEKKEEEEEEEEEKEKGKEVDTVAQATRWEPVDLVGVVMQILAIFLRNEYKAAATSGSKKKKEKGGEATSSEEDTPFLRQLARHEKVRQTMVDGLFDALGTFFDAMDHSSPSKHKVLVSYIASAIEVLYFCSWDEEYVSELVVSDCMHQGRAFSMLKKVLLMEQAEIVSNMLRWLLRFSEYEDPPTQDILAGYELDSRLLHSIIERNNTAMVAWGAKQPYNSLACDLLKAVEIFADDSNFKAQVIDSSAEALATVLKRGAEYNGFGKADSMHLSFTYAFFKLLAALHCFNAQVMPADQENHFVIALAGECRTKEHRDGVRGSLEFLLTLPEVIKRAKENTCDPVMEEDLALVEELLGAFNEQCERGKKPSTPKAGGGGAKKDKEAKAKPDKDKEELRVKVSGGRGKGSGPGSGGGGSPAGGARGRKRGRDGEMLGMTEAEQMRLAIQASLQHK